MTDLHGLHLPGAGIDHEQPATTRLQRELPGCAAGAEEAGKRRLLVQRLLHVDDREVREGAVDDGHALSGDDLIEAVPGQVILDGEFAGDRRLVAHSTSRSVPRRWCSRFALTMYATAPGC